MNAAMGLFLLAFLAPAVTKGGELALWVQVVLAVFCLPVVLVALACLTSAARPGSLGRAARRSRAKRRARAAASAAQEPDS